MGIFGRPKHQPVVLTPSDDGEYLTGYLDDLRDSSGHPLEARLRQKCDGKLWYAEAFDLEGASVLEFPCVRVSQGDALDDLVRRLGAKYSTSSGRPSGWMLGIVHALGLLSGLGVLMQVALFLARVLGIDAPFP